MCQRLPHSHPVIGIPQFITAFGEAIHHSFFCNECFDNTQSSQRLFQL